MIPKIVFRVSFAGKVSKEKEAPADCQDAYSFDDSTMRYAVSDGVGQSFFPGIWAQLLVDRFVHDSDKSNKSLFEHKDWQQWLEPSRADWQQSVEETIKKRKDLYYLRNQFNEQKKKPAGATFVGLEIEPNRLSWQAIIIGDSCLFQFTEGKVHSYPLQDPLEFGSFPHYFASLRSQQQHEPVFFEGSFRQNDLFVLTTDALAKWLLINLVTTPHIANEDVIDWRTLTEIQDWDSFYSFAQRARHAKEYRLDNDDTTLVVVHVTEHSDRFVLPTAVTTPPVIQSAKLEPAIVQDWNAVRKLPKNPLAQRKNLMDARQSGLHEQQSYPQNSDHFPETPHRRSQSFHMHNSRSLSIVALIVSVLSLAISLSLLWQDWQTTSDSDTRSDATTSILSPAPLTAESEESMPTETPSTSVPLIGHSLQVRSGTLVQMLPDSSSTILMRIDRATDVQLIEISPNEDTNWVQIQLDVWVFRPENSTGFLINPEGEIVVENPLAAWTRPSTESLQLGLLESGGRFTVVREQSNEPDGTWYQFQVNGFVAVDQ